ncbi:hypothetical protein CWT12_00375 [Actinomyces sp. 432]|nr:hypothetical protein CWT12_00375 [Actinomyces sp. 432]
MGSTTAGEHTYSCQQRQPVRSPQYPHHSIRTTHTQSERNTRMDAKFTSTPAAKSDLLDEITEQDYVTANGGFFPWLSRKLGNTGYVCTLTKECQRMCN